MKYSSELFLNDGNGVSEDGKHFIIHRLNPERGLPNQPEYIDEEIPIEDGEGWAAEYRKEQKTWATREEAYHDKQINVSGVPTEDGENPMEVVLDLIADNKFSPEVLFEYVDNAEEEKREKMKSLLCQHIEELPEKWQEIIFRKYNKNMYFEDMAREDSEKEGKKKYNQYYSRAHMSAINRLKDKFEKDGYEVDRTEPPKTGKRSKGR